MGEGEDIVVVVGVEVGFSFVVVVHVGGDCDGCRCDGGGGVIGSDGGGNLNGCSGGDGGGWLVVEHI